MSDYFKHPMALVETATIGSGTRIWAFAHVMNGASIGSNCNIGEHCFIESGVRLGDRVTVKNGVDVWAGVTIEDDVFLGPNVVLTNDLRPRSRIPSEIVATTLHRGATIGANATVVCGNEVGCYAMVGAGSVVTRDVPDYALVVGNPARLRGFVCACGATLDFISEIASCQCGRTFGKIDGNVRLT